MYEYRVRLYQLAVTVEFSQAVSKCIGLLFTTSL